MDLGAPMTEAMLPGVPEALALLAQRTGDAPNASGEPMVAHARGTLAVLDGLKVDLPTRIAAVLADSGGAITVEEVEAQWGREVRTLVEGMESLLRLKALTQRTREPDSAAQRERVRRMTLAMASDIRVVLIRLSSRLQTLRWFAQSKQAPDLDLVRETLDFLTPLANRLGLGQLKWELEDLSFRFLEPELYRRIARQLEERRQERETFVRSAIARLENALTGLGLSAEVSGRPKHIYSIYNKMRSKNLSFDQVQDLRAFRVLVDEVKDCYLVLDTVHQLWPPIPEEYDDYISRPKPNGYRSLHTVVTAEDDRPIEVQIRTRAMHRAAEFGVASHWRYKEASLAAAAGARAVPAPRAPGRSAEPIAPEVASADRMEWLRQVLMWQQEVGATLGGPVATGSDQDRIYLLTPQGKVVELPAGSTPIDFAYHVHTALGHRCRGARVDSQMVPLNTALRNGQTVEIIAARGTLGTEGPSRDWLNPQLGFVRSPRARAKVRQWFHALEIERDLAVGRERLERALQREGRTALGHDEVARRLGHGGTDALYLALAREEIGPRAIEEAVRAGGAPAETRDAAAPSDPTQRLEGLRLRHRSHSAAAGGSVSVVGVDALMTQLARCCRPVPPDPILGFVTRGRGISIHRAECRSLAELRRRAPDRVLAAEWPQQDGIAQKPASTYPVDVLLRARDRQGLLRDVSEVFARDRLNVTGVQTLTRQGVAQMQFTLEVSSIPQLQRTLGAVREVEGVFECTRR